MLFHQILHKFRKISGGEIIKNVLVVVCQRVRQLGDEVVGLGAVLRTVDAAHLQREKH